MGCNSSRNTSVSINKVKILHTEPPIDSPEKLIIKASQFVRKKTYNIQKDYKLGPILGSGSFGSVRLAIHILTGQERAIKSVKKSKIAQNPNEKSQFLAEIDILRQIDHPNVLKIFEFYEDANNYHLVTELVKGGELFEFIVSSGVLSESIAAHFLRQILIAVNYCHQIGIAHRDLKPENLLLEKRSPYSNLKVIDFGASALYSDCKTLNSRFGTSYYIAPEVLKRSYNEKCDIWSCGVILYILLSGKPPFGGKNDKEILARVSKGTYNFKGTTWDSVSDAAKDLIKRMLEFNPALRISAEDALKDPWFTLSLEEKSFRVLPSIIDNMKAFRATEKLQHAVLAFISSQLSSKDETKQLADTFKAIDQNGDGKISKHELLEEFVKSMSAEQATDEVERIFGSADMDQNGFLDYSEFLTVTLKKETMISKKNLEATFQIFDRDGDGSISAEELKSILGENIASEDGIWAQIITKVDQDGDGQINLREFKDMMMKLFEDKECCGNN